MLVAVVDAATPEPDAVRVGGLAAVVAPASDAGDAGEGLLRHAALVDAVFSRHSAVVPARAGTTVDPDALRDWLSERLEELLTTLALVRDRCELAVTWRRGEGDPSSGSTAGAEGSSGAAYLAGLKATWAAADRAEAVVDGLRSAAAVVDVRVLSRSPEAVKASVLVARDRWDEVRDQVASWASDGGTWRCTGPYPPYSFVAAGTGA